MFVLLLVKMLEGKAVLQETDMPEMMQRHVMELAHQALDAHEVSDCQSIAHFIKQVYLKYHTHLILLLGLEGIIILVL